MSLTQRLCKVYAHVLAKAKDDKLWSEKVEPKWHPPEGTFTKSATQIVEILLRGAKGNVTKALQRLDFEINRGGDKLHNKSALLKAKTMLKNKNK